MTPTEAIQRAVNVLRRQHKSIATERSYIAWLRRFMVAVAQMPSALPSESKIERFLSDLALRAQVSASTQNQAFNAILFFYRDVLKVELKGMDALRAARPKHLRHAPTVAETRALIAAVRDVAGYPVNLIVRLLYGCGLRLSEPLNLRIKDVDIANGKLFIMGAKGGKDRVVALPCALAGEMRGQMDFARAIWQRDQKMGVPLEIPGALGRKYPEFRFAWPWAWLFPSHQPCRHPRTGEIVRYHQHPSNVQRGVKEARRRLGIMVLPHELRHAYATHLIERGVHLKALKEAMGHSSIITTDGYCHAEALSVPSPLDS